MLIGYAERGKGVHRVLVEFPAKYVHIEGDRDDSADPSLVRIAEVRATAIDCMFVGHNCTLETSEGHNVVRPTELKLGGLVESWLRWSSVWREHPGEPSPWEDLLVGPPDRVRLSPDLAVMRQLQRESLVRG